jgi:hypothetical protein
MSIGHWTWPYILIPHTLGEPVPHRYTNLKADAHTYSTKHTHSPLSHTSKHGALLARAAEAGADFSFQKNTSLTNIQFTHKQEFMWGVHNTRLLTHNPTMRCRMCGQFTSNGHMAGNCPTMPGLRHDRHNSALQLLLSLLERHNGGRWETITVDFGKKPIKSFASPLMPTLHLTVTHLTPPTCPPTLSVVTKVSRPTP